MKATPEGKVKEAVKKLLETHGVMSAKDAHRFTRACRGWYYMPVQNGMGVTSIPDFVGHYNGKFFAIETKAPGKKPTKLQEYQLEAIKISGAKSFVIDCDTKMLDLVEWLSVS